MGKLFVLAISLAVILYDRGALSQLAACPNGQSECDSDEDNSICNSGNCQCNTIHQEASNNCSPKTCTLADIVATTCGTNTVCEAFPAAYTCLCMVNHSPGLTGCEPTECTTSDVVTTCGAGFVCTDSKCACGAGLVPSGSLCKTDCSGSVVCPANAACVGGVCECNVNFENTGAACAAITGCTTNNLAKCHPNSECDSTSGTATCVCATGWETDGTVCKKTCAVNDVPSVCAGNAGCVSLKCECNVNYAGDGGNTCTQKICSDNDTTNCDANSKCMANKCFCADNFVDTSGTSCECPASTFIVVGTECKKVCTVGAAESGCGTNAVCISDKCECPINFEGNAATACTQKVCTGTNTSTCDANSKCMADKCVCADNFVASNTNCTCSTTGFTLVGTACKKDCNAVSDCGTSAFCISSKCECPVNFEGNAADACTQKACSGTNNSTCDSNSVCEASKCECAPGYKAATDKIECENSGTNNLCNNFTLLMAAVLMLFFTSNTY